MNKKIPKMIPVTLYWAMTVFSIKWMGAVLRNSHFIHGLLVLILWMIVFNWLFLDLADILKEEEK